MRKKLKQYVKNNKEYQPKYLKEVSIAKNVLLETFKKELRIQGPASRAYTYKGHYYVTINNIPVKRSDIDIFCDDVIVKNLNNYHCPTKVKSEVDKTYFDGFFHKLLCQLSLSKPKHTYRHYNVYDVKCVLNENKFLEDMSAEDIEKDIKRSNYKHHDVVCS
jgi:hypothetical protein